MTLLTTVGFNFLFYSFCGWIIEGLFNLYSNGKFTKYNFLKLPIKPMYGIASVLLIAIHTFMPLYIFIPSCFIIPLLVEYTTAYLLDYYMNIKCWDYSTLKYNIKGYICLRFAIYWFILSFILIYFVHPIIEALYLKIEGLWLYFFPVIFLIFITDSILSIKNNLEAKLYK